MDTNISHIQRVWSEMVEQAERNSSNVPPLEEDKAILHASSTIKRLEEELDSCREDLLESSLSFEHVDIDTLPKPPSGVSL